MLPRDFVGVRWLVGRSCGRSAVKDGRHYDVAREASFDEAKAQHQCSTGVERRRIVIVAGKRSICRNWQVCSGYADAENRKPRNHSL